MTNDDPRSVLSTLVGDFNRYTFYEHCELLTALPPEALCCDEGADAFRSTPDGIRLRGGILAF